MRNGVLLAVVAVLLSLTLNGCGGDGFVPLFDGRTLEGWHADGGDIAAWKAEDGVLRCVGGGGGWLATDETYADFILELDWKIPPEGNSGVGLRFPPESHVSQTGMEIQVLDDEAEKHRDIKPAQQTGSIYYQVAARQGAANSPGEWNHFRITCDGPLVVIELNGTEVTRANMDEYTVGQGGLTPLAQRPRSGHIGVQNHQTGVDFRNIRIKVLNGN
ncbi:MAG: DUF1080 domain-containing protein [Candidatus Glassbacteria bacterium]|nr:DUF1080 domain-containing protein [Candidatus Glassbacteria bacterium]